MFCGLSPLAEINDSFLCEEKLVPCLSRRPSRKEKTMFIYEKVPLGECGAYLDYINSDKFRFSLLCVTLKLGRLSLAEKKALYALCTLMERSNSECPSAADYDVALGMLYSPVISFGFCEERGGEVLLTVSCDFAGGNVFGEELFCKVLDFLHTSFYSPVIGTAHFEPVLADTLDFIRGNLLADSGDPETFAANRYADRAECFSKRISEPLNFAEKQTIPDTICCDDVSAIYEKVRAASAVYAFFIGKENKDDVTAGIRRVFPRMSELSLPKREKRTVEACEVFGDGPVGNMTRLYLGYSYECKREVAVLLAAYLGACPQSRLFTVLREQKRYCYSVQAYCSHPGVITVFATVGTRVEEMTRECISEILSEAAKEIDPSVFRAAKETARLTASEVYDSRSLCEACCFSAFAGNRDEPFGLSEKLDALTEEDIRAAAGSLALVVDYACKGNPMPITGRGYTKGEWID